MEIKIPEEEIRREVQRIVVDLNLVPKRDVVGKTIDLEEFRKKYCGGRSKAWVKQEILYKFKPDWVTDIHPSRGRKIVIFEYPASQWMEEHRKDIDWKAKLR